MSKMGWGWVGGGVQGGAKRERVERESRESREKEREQREKCKLMRIKEKREKLFTLMRIQFVDDFTKNQLYI